MLCDDNEPLILQTTWTLNSQPSKLLNKTTHDSPDYPRLRHYEVGTTSVSIYIILNRITAIYYNNIIIIIIFF